MTILSQEELKNLMAKREETCVSIYLPTEPAGPQTRQNPIRFKNLVAEAEKRLTQQGWDSSRAEKFLEPIRALDVPEFWRHQNEGLAVFIGQDFFRYYRLPLNFEELVVGSDRFHLKPLVPLFTSNGKFFILALSQNEVRLLQGTRYSVSEIYLDGKVPQSLAEALKYDLPQEHLQMHTGNPNPAGGKSLIFHGHGVGSTDNKNEIWRYFQKIDAGLQEILAEVRSPLVLAGVEYLLSIYKEANSYQNLLDEGITGNPENLKPEELHLKAWHIVQPYFHQSEEAAARRYEELAGANTGKASSNLEEIVKAAYHQRVDSLFVIPDEHQWGRFDPETNGVELHPEAQPKDEDLLDFVTVHTFLNGGHVYTKQPEKLPEDGKIAAILRY